MDKSSKNKIAKIMERHGVVAGYLFGSAVNGKMGPHSDIDVAVLFDENVISSDRQFDEMLEISAEISEVCGVQNTDVINLNKVTDPLIRYESVILGERIFTNDISKETSLAYHVLREYEDTRHLRNTAYALLKERIKSGAFGRPYAKVKK